MNLYRNNVTGPSCFYRLVLARTLEGLLTNIMKHALCVEKGASLSFEVVLVLAETHVREITEGR